MATRIAFSTHYPDRMGELAGKPTQFPEKILKGVYDGSTYYMVECKNCGWIGSSAHCGGGHQLADTGDYSDPECPKCFSRAAIDDAEYDFGYYGNSELRPKTTTIRKNYDYWKSKEGQLIQPFFWAGKPYRSKQVVFCPEVRLKRVCKVKILPSERLIEFEDSSFRKGYSVIGKGQLIPLTQHEGFDHPDHFWMWFNEDFDGALLELESVEL